MSLAAQTLWITDHFYDARDPDAVDRQGRLQNCMIMVAICHVLLLIGFLKLQEFELAHPRIIVDHHVAFEIIPPPPPPKPYQPPKELADRPGLVKNPGSAPAPSATKVEKLELPQLPIPKVTETPVQIPAKPVPSKRTIAAAPVSLTPTNLIQSPNAETNLPKEAPTKEAPTTTAGAPSDRTASGTDAAGGSSAEGGTGVGGEGNGGTGTGLGGLGSGTGEGPAGGITTALNPQRGRIGQTMGNIAPYRKDLLMRLAQHWHPKKSYSLVVLITLRNDGALQAAEIFESSGSKKADKEALAAIEQTQFAPLPEWYKGETLTFKIDLSRVEAYQ